MSERFEVQLLNDAHDRKEFHCGVEPLDRYFREQVGQDVKRRVSACFVALELATGKVAGFYTLAAAGVLLEALPESLIKRLPRYPSVPVARLGRLAVDRRYRGQRLGGALVWDAVARSARSEVAVAALVVDAKDDQAAAFYLHLGFVPIRADGRQLVFALPRGKTSG